MEAQQAGVTCYTFAFKELSLGNLSQEPGGPRSPAVFGSIISYVEQFFETVGISLAERQVHPSLFSPQWWDIYKPIQ